MQGSMAEPTRQILCPTTASSNWRCSDCAWSQPFVRRPELIPNGPSNAIEDAFNRHKCTEHRRPEGRVLTLAAHVRRHRRLPNNDQGRTLLSKGSVREISQFAVVSAPEIAKIPMRRRPRSKRHQTGSDAALGTIAHQSFSRRRRLSQSVRVVPSPA